MGHLNHFLASSQHPGQMVAMFGLVLLVPCSVAYWMQDESLPVFLDAPAPLRSGVALPYGC
ncbi:MAG: hypothetical protein P0107_02405 [Nitrosomonas sp.]|nr:hypothetical protein [Nitrosomonas sp.]